MREHVHRPDSRDTVFPGKHGKVAGLRSRIAAYIHYSFGSGFQYDLNDEKDRRKYEIWKKAMEEAERYYFDLLEAGAKPEEARSILPNSLKTEIVVTMDIREWRHFIRLRGGHAAHPQIREITKMILEEFSRRYPVIFDDLKIEE